jgi:hypothetical protein
MAHALYNFYNSPDSFDFDTTADENDPPFVINENLTTYNAPERSQAIYDWITH